jgi:hypothetical protein
VGWPTVGESGVQWSLETQSEGQEVGRDRDHGSRKHW